MIVFSGPRQLEEQLDAVERDAEELAARISEEGGGRGKALRSAVFSAA